MVHYETASTHDITLQGMRVLLCPLTENDWEILLKWNNDPDVLYYSESENVASHSLQQVQYMYGMVSQNAYCFIAEYKCQTIGECWLQRMNLDRILKLYQGKDCCRIDLMIGEKNLWGQGLGTEIIGILTRFGFEREYADIMFGCDIADYNLRSLKAFHNNGYKIISTNKCTLGDKAQYTFDLATSREDYIGNQ
jgi:RimJ/RimL family protein N-acetyltransferase